MRKVVLFIAMSLDGYIADIHGGTGWLEGQVSGENDMVSYEEFIQNVDTVIMGAATYHQLVTELSPNEWAYPDLTSYIITHTPKQSTDQIRFTEEHPCQLVNRLKKETGKDIWICGGASIVKQLMQADLIEQYYINIIPTILGNGIRLFDTFEKEIKLTLIKTRSYNGITDLVYEKRMMEYRILQEQEINRGLFHTFIRHQVVNQCLRRENGDWVVRSDPFIDDWSEEDYRFLVACLRNTVRTGGFVCGAFSDGKLKGFVSVENGFFGGENRYYDLSSLHVSEDMRRNGIGKTLFLTAAEWAGKQGAKKLYISAHSAIESQAFYRSMGCVEASEYHQKHVEAEPYDCQLEYVL